MNKSITGISTLKESLVDYRQELHDELYNILKFWMENTIDEGYGGFYGSVNNENQPRKKASKGLVLNSRILWTFSAAYNFTKEIKYRQVAERAYRYIVNNFVDKEYGGVFWSLNYNGKIADDKKQVYGIAFCIYGLSEYYKASGNYFSLQLAIELCNFIENKSFDKGYGGYFEAYTRDWQILNDMRLSAKDENEKKTANTHLHIIEAYANLYKIWPDNKLKQRILALLDLFEEHFFNDRTNHLDLFLDETWNSKSDLVSYGHDIEASWLLLDCAEATGENKYKKRFKNIALRLANAALEGMDDENGMWYEYFVSGNLLIKEKHWWPQNEAMIGFFNAWQLSGDEQYLDVSINCWNFSKIFLIDKRNGEWFWGVDEKNNVMQGQDKAGFWKCPYHNSRACMQLINRIDRQIDQDI